MFNSIVESVLNEITATDAYERFYSDLPKEEFFGLTNMYGKFDNLMKMLMNDIKSGDSSFKTAGEFIQKYVSAENGIRAKFSKMFNDGLIENTDEADLELDVLLKLGDVTEKQIYDNGLLILHEDENCKITCTTNYGSNSHFYGHTSWCTASDRNGRYDGYRMFLYYTYEIPYDDEEVTSEDIYDTIISNVPQYCLFQYIDKNTKKTYQMQIDSSFKAHQVCDEKDTNCEMPNNPILLEVIKRDYKKCYDITQKNSVKEFNFQEYYEAYQERRDRIKKKKFLRVLDTYYNKANTLNIKKVEFVKKMFNSLVNSDLLKNYEFCIDIINSKVNQSINMDNNKMHEYEGFLKTHGYLRLHRFNRVKDTNYLYAELRPTYGIVTDVIPNDRTNTVNLKEIFSYNIIHSTISTRYSSRLRTYYPEFSNSVFLILDVEAKKVIDVVVSKEEWASEKEQIIALGNKTELKSYFIIPYSKNEHYLVNCLNNEKIQLPEEIFDGYCDYTLSFLEYENGVFIGHNPYYYSKICCYFNLKTKKIEKFRVNVISKGLVFWNNNRTLLCYKKHGSRLGTYISDFVELNYRPSFDVFSNDSETIEARMSFSETKLFFLNGKVVDVYDLIQNKVITQGALISSYKYGKDCYRYFIEYYDNNNLQKVDLGFPNY